MLKLATALVLVAVALANAQSHTWQTFHWINSKNVNQQRDLMRFAVAGQEGGDGEGQSEKLSLYISRSWYKHNWIPGKCFFRGDGRDGDAFFSVDGEEHWHVDFEVLYTPQDSTIWVQSNGTITTDALSAGTDPNTGEVTYICRASTDGNNLIVGRAQGGICHLPYEGTTEKTEFEVLALTKKGKELARQVYRVYENCCRQQ